MILTRPRSRNHHRANPLKVAKMWIGLLWTLQKDVQKKADDDVWRRSRDEIAEEEGCSERFFVGFDRE